MTDAEYLTFLNALAGKHIRHLTSQQADEARTVLEELSSSYRLWKLGPDAGSEMGPAQTRPQRKSISNFVFLSDVATIMEQVGILPALDEAPSLVFGEFRRSAVPAEDIELLRRAGHTNDEIEVFLAIAEESAHRLAHDPLEPSEVLEAAAQYFQRREHSSTSPAAEHPRSAKRKWLNGIGKILSGSIAGVGNALVAAGTIVAPNPATAYGAIASGALAVSGIFSGLGDIRGE